MEVGTEVVVLVAVLDGAVVALAGVAVPVDSAVVTATVFPTVLVAVDSPVVLDGVVAVK
ncbi:hypothetical protein [Acanthamoeba polyphaga mimivirus]|nr:hypothetical protein [Acanthamoeba polyphaga mimivirus]